jgi:hypothetical protein
MDKYKYLDDDGRRSFSANADDAPILDLAIAYLCALLEITAAKAITDAVILQALDLGMEQENGKNN